MKPTGKHVGLFGGTFDPVHIGHIIIADLVADSARLDTVVFIPSARPPHKGASELMFTAEQRFSMLEQSVSGDPRFIVSDIEMRRTGPSFTIDTIREMKQSLPPDTDIRFIVGMDNLYEISMWKSPREIIRECPIIAARRDCDAKGVLPDWLMEHVEIVDVPLIGVSSSDIRRRIQEGSSIRYLVPGPVLEAVGLPGR